MDGIHDLGGKHGHGKVFEDPAEYNQDAVPLPARWQGAIFTTVNAIGGAGVFRGIDHFRHAVERIDPVNYLNDGYYGRWLGAAETLLIEAGVLTQAEITARAVERGGDPDARIAARPGAVMGKPERLPGGEAGTAQRESSAPRAFAVGDAVVTQSTSPSGHTRLPAYARGVRGVVVACHDAWVFPDTAAHEANDDPQHLYTVRFDASALWGGAGEPGTEVCIDLFEPYLDPISQDG